MIGYVHNFRPNCSDLIFTQEIAKAEYAYMYTIKITIENNFAFTHSFWSVKSKIVTQLTFNLFP